MPRPGKMENADGWVQTSTGEWIHPDSAESTQIDENTATGVTTVTITYGGATYVQTITTSVPQTNVNRTVVSGWVKQ